MRRGYKSANGAQKATNGTTNQQKETTTTMGQWAAILNTQSECPTCKYSAILDLHTRDLIFPI